MMGQKQAVGPLSLGALLKEGYPGPAAATSRDTRFPGGPGRDILFPDFGIESVLLGHGSDETGVGVRSGSAETVIEVTEDEVAIPRLPKGLRKAPRSPARRKSRASAGLPGRSPVAGAGSPDHVGAEVAMERFGEEIDPSACWPVSRSAT